MRKNIYENIPLDEDGVPVEIYAEEETEKPKKTTAIQFVTEEPVTETVKTEVTEVHNEFTKPKPAETFIISAEKQEADETEEAEPAVIEISEKNTGTETAAPPIQTETVIRYNAETAIRENVQTTVSLKSETLAVTETEVRTVNNSASNNAQAFLLLAGVFGAAAAAAVYFGKAKRKKLSETADMSKLSAKERDSIRLDKEKKPKPVKKIRRVKRIIPKTAQKTLPYKCLCADGIMKVDDNKYSKTYRFEDVNYSIAKQEEQEGIFLGYCSVLNSFDTSADIQITVHNNRVNKEDFNKMVLLKHKGNDFDRYVDVYNDMLVDKMEQG